MDHLVYAVLAGVIMLEIRTQRKLGAIEEHIKYLNSQLYYPFYGRSKKALDQGNSESSWNSANLSWNGRNYARPVLGRIRSCLGRIRVLLL